MKIAAEIPLSCLGDLYQYTDYPFLINIYRNIPEYVEFYKKACAESDVSFLDSGFFENWENGTNFDTSINSLKEGVEIFHPKYVFSEEKLGDREYTVSKAKEFKEFFGDTVKIATCVQGSTFEEWIKCFEELDKISDCIAISHMFPFHNELIEKYPNLKHDDKYFEKTKVRLYVIGYILNYYKGDKPIHLLGCNNPLEIMLFDDPRLKTADTSSPVVSGFNGVRYTSSGILLGGKIHQGADYINKKIELTDEIINDVEWNCKILRGEQ